MLGMQSYIACQAGKLENCEHPEEETAMRLRSARRAVNRSVSFWALSLDELPAPLGIANYPFDLSKRQNVLKIAEAGSRLSIQNKAINPGRLKFG